MPVAFQNRTCEQQVQWLEIESGGAREWEWLMSWCQWRGGHGAGSLTDRLEFLVKIKSG